MSLPPHSLECTLGKKSYGLHLNFKPSREEQWIGKEGSTARLVLEDQSVLEVARKTGNGDKPHPNACSESTGPFLHKEAPMPGLVLIVGAITLLCTQIGC